MMPQIVPMLTQSMGPYGGLFVQRRYVNRLYKLFVNQCNSVAEWTFHCDDPLLNLLEQNPPPCSFKTNSTISAPNTIFSGKSNLTQVITSLLWSCTSNSPLDQPVSKLAKSHIRPRMATTHPSGWSYSARSVRTLWRKSRSTLCLARWPRPHCLLELLRTFSSRGNRYREVLSLVALLLLILCTDIFSISKAHLA